MDSNAVLIFGALLVLALLVFGVLWSRQRGKASLEGTAKTALGEIGVKMTKEASPQGPVQNQAGGTGNEQTSVKEATSKQSQIGGKNNKQTVK